MYKKLQLENGGELYTIKGIQHSKNNIDFVDQYFFLFRIIQIKRNEK